MEKRIDTPQVIIVYVTNQSHQALQSTHALHSLQPSQALQLSQALQSLHLPDGASLVPPAITADTFPPADTASLVPPAITADTVPPADTASLVPPAITADTVPPADTVPLLDRLRQVIVSSAASCRPKTTVNRTTAVNAFERFLRDRPSPAAPVPADSSAGSAPAPLTAAMLTPDHLRAFELWHRDQQLSLNYSACNMRNLRSLLTHILGRAHSSRLFETVRTSGIAPQHPDVSRDALRQLFTLPLADGTAEARVRDITEFRFRANGMPLIDAAHLLKSQLRDGHITFYRHKTHVRATVLVTPRMQQLIDRLSSNDSPYLLPILNTAPSSTAATVPADSSAGSPPVAPSPSADRQYARQLQLHNRTLRRLAARISPDLRITTYTPRHAWATLAYDAGENINYISRAMMHTSTDTTRAYIHGVSQCHIDNITRRTQAFLDQ